MNWTDGFTGSYFATYVDPISWRDIERFEITGGSITKSNTDLRVTASLDCTDYPQGTERWIRVYLDAKQGASGTREPLFTGLATSPGVEINGTLVENKVECYSVLKPAEDILLDRGWYIPAETDGAQAIKRLLAVTPAPVDVDENAPTLNEAIIAEDGETNLTMIDKVLKAIGWRLRVDGDGTIRVTAPATNADVMYDPIDNDAIEPKITITRDWYDVPNVFRAISDGVSGVAKDENDYSPYSIQNRGREVWAEEDDCDLSGYETIAEYAIRRLREEQQVGISVKYTRRYNPALQPGDLVRLHYPAQGLDGLYKITSQNIAIGGGCSVSEEVNFNGYY